MYAWFYRTLLSRTDAEWAHHFGVWSFRWGAPVLRAARALRLTPRRHQPAVRVWDVDLPGRVGLAAGMDKNGQAVRGLLAAGFAWVEVGTVTPLAQPGNPRPRSWREADVQGLRNAMGFNNDGAQALARRLARIRARRWGQSACIGVNLGKNKVTDPADAPRDYRVGAATLAPYADYLVVNVSSPNTPGLRDLQSVESLRPILEQARAGAQEAVPGRRVPLLVKIAPDLADADVDAVTDLAVELGLEGVVATNTTIRHERGPGGLSGPPVHARAVEVVRRVSARAGERLVVVGVGGIDSEAAAREFLDAGATLVQVYTGLVYRGPRWVARLNATL